MGKCLQAIIIQTLIVIINILSRPEVTGCGHVRLAAIDRIAMYNCIVHRLKKKLAT